MVVSSTEDVLGKFPKPSHGTQQQLSYWALQLNLVKLLIIVTGIPRVRGLAGSLEIAFVL